MALKIAQLPVNNLTDIPKCLRGLANNIEDGKIPAAQVIVVVEAIDKADPEPWIFAYGRVEKVHSTIGLLHVALHKLGIIALDPTGGRHEIPNKPA